MINQEEYNNVIRATYSLCQQIHNMELAGSLTFVNTQITKENTDVDLGRLDLGPKVIPGLSDEAIEERALLYALLTAKNSFPRTFLEGCRNAQTTKEIRFRTQYPGSFITDVPS